MKYSLLLTILMSVSLIGYTQCGYFGSIENDNDEEHLCQFINGMRHIVVTNLSTCNVDTMKVEMSNIVVRRNNTRLTMAVDHDNFDDYLYRIKYPTDEFLNERWAN